MRTRIVDSVEGLAPYLDAWEEILRENGNTNPYLTPQWVACWWRFFGSGRRMHVVALLDGAKPVGFCPLMLTKKPLRAVVEFIGSPQAWRMGFVARRGYEAALVRAAIGSLILMKGNVAASLHGLCREDPCRGILMEELEHRPHNVYTMPCYIIRTAGRSGAEYIKGRAAHHTVRKVLSREKALAKTASLSFTTAGTDEVDSIFPLHEKRWSKKNDGNGFGRGRQREFHSFLAKIGDHGAFRVAVYLLKVGSMPIAFNYGIECGGRYTSLRIAHDDDFAAYGPGMIMKKRMLEACFAQACETIDFAAGDEQHKREWTDECELYDRVEFGTDTALIRSMLLASRLTHGIRMRLKENPALVRLKRDGIGRVKYCLSGAPVRAYLERAMRALRQRGISGLPEAIAGFSSVPGSEKECRAFRVSPDHSASPGVSPIDLRSPGLDEIAVIHEEANLTAPKIAGRYLKGSGCMLLLRGGRVVGTAWTCDCELRVKEEALWSPTEPGDRCVYGIRLTGGGGAAAAREALACLAAQPLPKNCHSLTFLLSKKDRALLRAAEALFLKEEQPKPADYPEQPSAAARLSAEQTQNA